MKITLNGVSVEVTKEQLQQALAEFDKPQFDYPICCKSKGNGTIVLFDGISSGTNLKIGDNNWVGIKTYEDGFIKHTDTNVWEQIPYDAERGLYHKQLVYCWNDKKDSHSAVIRFYNAESKCAFKHDGREHNITYKHYSATFPEHMKEFKEI